MLQLLQSLGSGSATRSVSLDFPHHPHFAVIALKQAKQVRSSVVPKGHPARLAWVFACSVPFVASLVSTSVFR
eukprot:scaffold110976_cov19-Prasinocladus_malaysianus.AAC.1